jgi:diaminopimelate decarboxylase
MEVFNLSKLTDVFIAQMCSDYGTPLYVYDSNVLQNTYQELRSHLHPLVEIFFSVKANPNLTIVNTLNRLGAGAEVSSLAELACAVKAGVRSEDILFVGPGKTTEELREAILREISCIAVESEKELEILNQLAAELNQRVRVALRINPSLVGRGAELVMSGKASQFGIDETWVLSQDRSWCSCFEHLRIVGIHTYMGTGILDWQIFVENTKYILDMSKRISQYLGFKLELIDFGGGLMSPVYENQEPVDLIQIQNHLSPYIDQFIEELGHQPRLIMESGRYLSAQCGLYLTKVLYTKNSKGVDFAIVDGGIHQNILDPFFRGIANEFVRYKESLLVRGRRHGN